MMKPSYALGHLTHPSDRSDLDNQRPPTSGEQDWFRASSKGVAIEHGRGPLAPPTRGPLAGIDLLHYCRTGQVRRLDGAALTEAQKGLR
jgi:hypothetical protein